MLWAAGTREKLSSGFPRDIPALTTLIERAAFVEPLLCQEPF